MLDRKALQALGCWTGYRLERGGSGRRAIAARLSLYLKPVSQIMYCEQCGARCQQIHETTVRRGTRDLPLFEYRVVLRTCLDAESGANAAAQRGWRSWTGLAATSRGDGAVCKACEKLLQAASVQARGGLLRTGRPHGQIDRQDALARARVAEPDWSTIRYLAMDEFALHKGHRYATVVVDPIGRQVLVWVGAPDGHARRRARLLRTTPRRRGRAHRSGRNRHDHGL
ncbi:transposase IS204///IS1165 family protein [Burkholderia pseudomallei MSHR4308]|nr:transposase IS204///IS1165 family protein [Burkholderia pseudomallei MSHR4308]